MIQGYWPSGMNVVVVFCHQWGDSGKGKIVNIYSSLADVIIRVLGGGNAGHTVWINGVKYVLHVIPVSIIYDALGKISVIGKGMVFDPADAMQELLALSQLGVTWKNLKISHRAHLILPSELLIDALNGYRVGSTGKGIGPCYTDHVARYGLTVNDLRNPRIFRQRLEDNLDYTLRVIRSFPAEVIREIMQRPRLGGGCFYNPADVFNVDAIVGRYTSLYGDFFRPNICDVEAFLASLPCETKILIEGAQGSLLSILYGTYPNVTSSDTSGEGHVQAAGMADRDDIYMLGIMKAPYITRVGEGSMPTELGGQLSDSWCRDLGDKGNLAESLLHRSGLMDLNSPCELVQGMSIRRTGNEFGATTGRLRRIGWFDLPMARYATSFERPGELAITKPDVCSGMQTIKVCTSYRYVGDPYEYGGRTYTRGMKLQTAVPDAYVLANVEPIYEELPGWKKELRTCREYLALPSGLKSFCFQVEETTGRRIRYVSVGCDREDTILRQG